MNSLLESMSDQDKQKQLTLGVLQAIEQRDDISQRHLAQEMGIALGLANSYLKRCVKKGWIKISTAPANRYLYYLTPTGFAEKAKLTAEFLTTSLTLFREAGDAYSKIFAECAEQGIKKVSFLGLSDLTEIAFLRSLDSPVSVASIVQTPKARDEIFGVPVEAALSQPVDAVIVTAMADVERLLQNIREAGHANPVLFPEFLQGIIIRAEDQIAAMPDMASPTDRSAEQLNNNA